MRTSIGQVDQGRLALIFPGRWYNMADNHHHHSNRGLSSISPHPSCVKKRFNCPWTSSGMLGSSPTHSLLSCLDYHSSWRLPSTHFSLTSQCVLFLHSLLIHHTNRVKTRKVARKGWMRREAPGGVMDEGRREGQGHIVYCSHTKYQTL